MQIQTGTCQITNGIARVIAALGVDWSDVVEGQSYFLPIIDPNLGANVYNIATKTAPSLSASGNWEVTLTGNITEATNSAQLYTIQKDFTGLNIALPIIVPGDVQTAAIWARMVNELDAKWGSGGPGGPGGMSNPMNTVGDLIIGGSGGSPLRLPAGTINYVLTSNGPAQAPSWKVAAGGPGADAGQGYIANTFTAAALYTTTPSGSRHRLRLSLNAGSAPYIANVVLDKTGRSAGDEISVSMVFAASINPQITIRDGGSAGTIRWSFNNNIDGAARSAWATFVYDGTNWLVWSSGFNQ